jgi:hypothetical protein
MPDFFVFTIGVVSIWILFVAVMAVATTDSMPRRRYPLIVLYAVVLHYVWGASLIANPGSGAATSLAGLAWLFGPKPLAIILFAVASMSLVFVAFESVRGIPSVLFALPQQAVLLMSAWAALTAMWSGEFADGVSRPVAFIVADQAPAVIAAALHAVAIVLTIMPLPRLYPR